MGAGVLLAAQWVVQPVPPMAVMIAGGAGDVEVWRPGTRQFERVAGMLGAAWQFGTATALPSGDVLVMGGYDQAITPTAQAWLVRRQGGAD